MGAVPKGLSEQEFGPTWLVRLLVENGEKEVRGADLGDPRREPTDFQPARQEDPETC